jgi:hypothetical protein
MLNDSVFLASLKYSCSPLSANFIPFKVNLFNTFVRHNKVSNHCGARLRNLVVAQIQFLKASIVIERGAESSQTCIAKSNVIPL